MSVYGAIVSAEQVEAALLGTLRMWLPAYLAEVSRQVGDEVPTLPRTWASRVDDTWWPEDRLPVVVITARGIPADGVEATGRAVDGWFEATVTAFVNGKGAEEARRVAERYAAAIRAVVVQRPSLGDFAQATAYRGEGYDLIAGEDDARSYAGGQVVVGVLVRDIADPFGGPEEPPGDPTTTPADGPTVAAHAETVEPKTREEEL